MQGHCIMYYLNEEKKRKKMMSGIKKSIIAGLRKMKDDITQH